ncbi:cation:proton antiporter [Pedobacter cryotolerans]|uniref:Sodium:proton antiporter n=1 Tax=Pedobacter cryotolerans TaxID=2571270 RepID=A0A4U1CCY9_9SPHI|nr:cation:proton antiporter [Pedobacter cryotolerans]TKC02623.1 sodium:proton antiporter [Pedobacter cryotolerans]
MTSYISIILLIGLSTLLMVFMPAVSKKIGISYSIIYVIIGVVLYAIFGSALPSPLPSSNPELTLHLTELIVIISLMGTGIKIDRDFSFKKWNTPLRLISFAMLLCIAACFLLGLGFLSLTLPSAILLGAVLAPTDPVLASDVQVGPPNDQTKSETKFSLTSEAGLNDGMAFPFVWLAITFSLIAQQKEASILNWIGYHLIYKIITGGLIGYLAGKAVGFLIFKLSKKYKVLKPTQGFLAISLTLCVYAITEIAHGYGFIAVFVSALVLRHSEKEHDFHLELHDFTEQIERLLLAVLLLFFGGAIVSGILEVLDIKMVIFCFVFVLIIRPLSAYISLLGRKISFKDKIAIGFFGIRGMGSIFYLSFALVTTTFTQEKELWAIVAFTILISIFIHGATADRILKYLKVETRSEK